MDATLTPLLAPRGEGWNGIGDDAGITAENGLMAIV